MAKAYFSLVAGAASMVARATAAAGAVLLLAAPAMAHHGKDFLLLETDDLPQPGHVYTLLSSDTSVETDGARSTEVTPGLLFAVGNRIAVEPHFHVTKATGEGWKYDATAGSVRYRIGDLPGSEWRAHVSVEAERPYRRSHDTPPVTPETGTPGDTTDAADVPHSEGTLRLGFTRTTDRTLMAVNLLATRTLARGGDHSYGFGLGALRPLANGDRIGLEILSRLPFADGVEVVPGYYLSRGATGLKFGVGVFTSRATTTGTLHASYIQRY